MEPIEIKRGKIAERLFCPKCEKPTWFEYMPGLMLETSRWRCRCCSWKITIEEKEKLKKENDLKSISFL